jgi:glyoxylase-like metal-dependent hydrolase (beta-lactamase superfamily II)
MRLRLSLRPLARSAGLATLVILAQACGDDSAEEPEDPESTLLDRTADALGGAAAIQGLGSERIDATGTRLDPGEARTSREAIEVSDYTYTLNHRLAEDRVQVDITSASEFLFPITMEYSLVIDDREGAIEGQADLFNPAAEPRPLRSTQLATRLKHNRVTSLSWVIRQMLASPDAVSEEEDVEHDGRPHHVLALESSDHPPLRLLIDPDSSLPAAIETVEHTPPVGDTLVQVRFAGYQDAGDLLLPYELTIDVDGIEVQRETRAAIEPGAADADDLYDVPAALETPFDETGGRRGWLSSQYFQGYELTGLSFLYDDPTEAPLTFVELAPGVFQVQGATHHVLLVEMSDHLVLVDAPLDDDYCERLRVAVAERFPDKPITTVVASHFHYDHVGGIRNFGADGELTVVTGADSADFHQAVFANPYTVAPDRYAASPAPVTIESVDDSTTITDGSRTIEVHRIEADHAADMLIAYLPAEGILFNSDLWSPQQGALVGYFLVGATDLADETARLGIPADTLVAGAHSTGTGTLAELAELLEAAP